jgi:hypothetical protein
MRHLRCAVDESLAVARIRGAKSGLIRRAWQRFFPPPDPVKVELVWCPAYLVTIGLDRSAGPDRATCFVEGFSGSFAIFEMLSAIADGEPAGETFNPSISAEEAERLAREGLVTTLLRRSGQARRAQPTATQSVELLRWPYWVYYHRRRRGGMDIQLLDAATGSRPGHKIKLGLLDAFRNQSRSRRMPGGGDTQ